MVEMMSLPDDSYRVYAGTVDLFAYDKEETEEIVSAFYDSYDQLKSACKNDEEADSILAECIFETEMREFPLVFTSQTEEEAIRFIKNYMTVYMQ